MRRGVSLNFLGWALPALLALASVPALARALGPDRFGVLALAWAAVAAFGMFDIGLGRATTFLVATDDVPRDRVVAGSGAWVWLLFGPLALILALNARWIATTALDVPAALIDETVSVVRMLALALPVAVHGIVLRAALEGEARWGLVNALRAPLGVITYGGPWLALSWTQDTRALVAVIVAGRVFYWLAQWAALGFALRQPAMRRLVEAGGWMSVSGIVAPLLSMADRAVIALVVPIATVGWYVSAADAAGRLWVVGAVLQPVLFQRMATLYAAGDSLWPVFRRGIAWTLGLLAVPVLVVLVWGDPLLQWWLATSYTAEAGVALRWFTVAVAVNCVAYVPYAALQAAGAARAAAIVHVAQLPLYLPLLWLGGQRYGALGVALLWGLRIAVDTAALLVLALRRLR